MQNQPHSTRHTPQPRQRLSPEISIELQYLDPQIHLEWRDRVNTVLRDLDSEQRKFAYLRYLIPKGIKVDTDSKQLTFSGRPTVEEVRVNLKSTRLIQIANKLRQVLEELRDEEDILTFVNTLEGSLCSIDDFNPDDNLSLQKEKWTLHQAYLDELVEVTRASNFSLPSNYRGLTPGAVKDFIVEVFLHHQMQGYRFKTLPLEKLEQHPDTFIREVVVPEARTRQCEAVQTERYLFLIGPTRDRRLNPYSARRFVTEETVMNDSAVFFNAMAIPFKSLDDQEIRDHLAWSMTRIVALERQVNADITALIDSFRVTRRDTLLPILVDNIASDGGSLGEAINKKLTAFEELCNTYIFGKLPHAILSLARTLDDHDYLLFHLRDLISQLASDIRLFAGHFAYAYTDTAYELELRLLSYLNLMDKRSDDIFTPNIQRQPDLLDKSQLPTLEFKAAIKEIKPKADALEQKIAEFEQVLRQPKTGFAGWWDRKMDGPAKRRAAYDRVCLDLNLKKKQCLVELIRTVKRHPILTVYLEFEGLVDVDETLRHYALPAGKGGLSELPKLIRLYENEADFNFADVMKKLGIKLTSKD